MNQFDCKDYDGSISPRRQSEGAIRIGTPEFITLAEKAIKDHNTRATNGTITFSTLEAAFLWVEEWLGQISDGKYENANLKWEEYFNLRVEVIPGATPYCTRLLKPVSFKDCLWLMEGCSDPKFDRRDDVRAIFSNVPTAQLKAFVTEVSLAFKKKKA